MDYVTQATHVVFFSSADKSLTYRTDLYTKLGACSFIRSSVI